MSVSQGLLPFDLDLTKKRDFVTAYAGLPVMFEAMLAVIAISLYRELRDALGYKSWKTVRRHLASLVLLIVAGGEHISDLAVLRADGGLEKLIGFQQSSPTQAKDFLYRFHQGLDGHLLTPEEDTELSVKGRATIRPEGPGLQILELLVRRVAEAIQAKDPKRRVTVDVDACIVEAKKKQALMAYEGTVGFQPQMAWWAEQRAWIRDQFRDGNVPAAYEVKGARAVGGGRQADQPGQQGVLVQDGLPLAGGLRLLATPVALRRAGHAPVRRGQRAAGPQAHAR